MIDFRWFHGGGEVPIDIPRDRKSEFEPRAIRKYETGCSGRMAKQNVRYLHIFLIQKKLER